MPNYKNIKKTQSIIEKQSQEVTNYVYEAEDILTVKNSPFMEENAPKKGKKTGKKVKTDEFINPIARQELSRRSRNRLEGGLDHTSLDLTIRDLGREHIMSEDIQMEKGWIRGQMKEMEARADKRKKDEVRAEERALEKLKVERQEEFDRAHNTEAHSRRLSGFLDNADNAMNSLLRKKQNKIAYMPTDSLLNNEYSTKFKERISSKVRDKKRKNKRSRLYQKGLLYDQVANAVSSYKAECYSAINDLMEHRMCDDEDYTDLSHFMIPGEKGVNKALLDLYLGKDQRKEGEGGFEGQDVQTALDKMLRQIFTTDLTEFNFESDSSMMKCSASLERLSNQLGAFDRMAEKHDYYSTLDEGTRQRVNSKLDSLRSIANYYNIRKEILSNSYYMTHYNDEMAMDFIWDKDDERREIGELLIKSQILGNTMMKLNGADKKKLRKFKEPSFHDSNKDGIYKDLKKALNSRKEQKNLLSAAYREKRVFDDASKRKRTIDVTAEDIKLKEQFDKNKRVRRVDPRRKYFFKTGVWKNNVTKEDAEKAEKTDKKWLLSEYLPDSENEIYGIDFVNDEAFVKGVTELNDTIVKNLEKIDKMEARQIREAFVSGFWDAHKAPPDDPEALAADKRDYEIHGTAICARVSSLVKLRLKPVDDFIRNIYKRRMKGNRWCVDKIAVSTDDGQVFLSLRNLAENQEQSDELEPIVRWANNLAVLEKELNLTSFMDESIYQSKTIQALILGEVAFDNKDYQIIKTRMKDNEAFLNEMISEKYDYAGYGILYGMRKFMGEKYLFGDYRTIRDLAERYLRSASLLNMADTKAEKDYQYAYSSVMKKGVFSSKLKKISATFLARSKNMDRRGRGPQNNEKGRVGRFKKRLTVIRTFDGILAENTKDLKLTGWGWDRLMYYCDFIVENALSRELTPENKEESKKLKEDMEHYITTTLETVKSQDAAHIKDEVLINRDTFLDVKPPQEKKKQQKGVKKFTVIHKDDYTFAGLLRGRGLVNNPLVIKHIPDPAIREFLADNVRSVIILNPELKDVFPYLKDIRSLDEMEKLSVIEFRQVLTYLVNNITEGELGTTVKRLLFDTAKENETAEQVHIRKYTLLEMMKHRTNPKDVSQIIKRIQEDYHSLEGVRLKRAQIALGRKAEERDGRIHYRFEDLPDQEKSFWKNNGWFVERLDHFDRAHNVWQKLEELSPYAVKQVKLWLRSIVEADESVDKEKRLNELAEMLQYDYETADKKKAELEAKGKKAPKDPDFAFKADLELSGRFRVHNGGKDLLKEIRDIFTKGQGISEKGKEKPIDIKKFILEMTMFDTQGVVLSHGGRGQSILWADKGAKSSAAYRKALLNQAKDSIEKVDMLDKALIKYENNKDLHKMLKDKLSPIVLSMAGSEYAKKTANDERISELRDTLETCNAYLKQYEEAEKAYTEIKIQAQEAVRKVSKKKKLDYHDVQKEIEKIPGGKETQDRATALREAAEDTRKERDAAEKELSELLSSATTVTTGFIDEMNENQGILGIDNFAGIERMLIGHVRENGELSNELCDNVALYESRKKLASEYGNGELAPLWEELIKNDEVFKDLIDPADTVAEQRIKELHEFFAPLGAATFEQYSYVSEFFISDNIQKLLDKSRPDTKKIVSELKEKSFEEKQKYWSGKLLEFHEEMLTKTKKGAGSVQENMRKAHGSLRDYLTKHFLYERPDFKEEVERQNEVMKTGLFADAENLQKLAKDHKQTLTQLARRRADAILDNIETYVMTDGELIEQAYDPETLKKLYRDIASHYVENIENAEKAFVRFILTTEKGMDVSGLDDKGLKERISGMDEADRISLKNRTDMFVSHINGPAISNNTEDFSAKVEEWAKSFVEETDKALTADISFTEEYREGAKKRYEERKKAALDVRITKNTGKATYDKLLFGGKLSELKTFGDVRQPVVYTEEKSRRGKIVSLGSDDDKKLFEEAKKFFKKEKDTDPEYPDILADCLDEYVRMQNSAYTKLDKFVSWIAREDTDVKREADRLKMIYNYGKEKAGIPDTAVDLYVTYAARFADKKDLTEAGLKYVTKEFVDYYEKLRKLEVNPPKHPVLKAAHEDAVEKMKAYFFIHENKTSGDLKEYTDLIDNQLSFFAQAGVCFPIIERVVAKDEYLGKLDKAYRMRYVNGLYEYFLGEITEDGIKAVNGEKEFDRKAFEEKVKERIGSSAAREVFLEKDSVSYLDMQEKNIIPGTVSQADFEKRMIDHMSRDDLAEYNKLDDEQKKLFAMSLYVVNKEERGTLRAVYGKKPDDIKAERNLILSYMKGEKVSFRVDYTRAMRALTARGENYKVVADEKLFDQAITFVKQVEKQKYELMPKDYDRLSDSEATAKAADLFRRQISKKIANYKTQTSEINNLEIVDKNAFLSTLENFSLSDQNRKGKESKTIGKVMGRVADLTVSQQSLLIYVLQDRTVLDYSTRGKNDNNIVPYVNEEKRFDMYERMLTEEGRLEVLKKTGDPELLEKSFKSLLSFQLKDDREFKTRLSKEDFADGALDRMYAVDWQLLDRAVDFVHEIENERIRLVAVRQAGELVRNDNEQSDNPAAKFYHIYRKKFIRNNEVSQSVQMDLAIGAAFKQDKDLITGSTFDNGDTLDDLMTGYNALTPAQKRLFFRALEHREILDVSQKNLYRNIFGLAERDFVDPKGRDTLIDEFLEKGDDVDTNIYTYDRALLSLCSTQINDDMDFLKMNGLNMVGENFTVTNQWFVSDRGTWLGRTAFDWKLFQRALQFVTRATNEKQITAGNSELYRALGDKEKNGEMKIDTSFMRTNLHHTGSRFMRFLAKEGYGKAVNQASTVIGLFDTAAAYTDYVISAKTSNYIYGKLNQAINKDVIEKQEEEENDEQVDLQKDLQDTVDEIKEAAGKVQEAKGKVVELELKLKDLNIHKGVEKDNAERAAAIDDAIKKAEKELEEAKSDEGILEHEHNQLLRKRDRIDRAISRETIQENNRVAKLQDMVSSIKEQEEIIKETAKQAKEGYDTIKEMFGFKKEEDEPEEVLDELEKKTKDVKVEERQKSLTGNPKLDKILGVVKMTPDIKEKLDNYLIGKPEMLEKVDSYAQAVFGGSIGAQAVGEFYDKAELWYEDKMVEFQNLAMPQELKDFIDDSLDFVMKSEDFVKNISSYVSDGVEILGHFRDIVGASKNIIKLNKANTEAKEAKADDDAAIDAVSETKFDVKLIRQAADNNLAFVKGGKTITKSIEGRKILASAGELAKKAASYADVKGIDEILDTAVHLADFFWKCMADNKSIKDYYTGAGNAELRKLDNGISVTKQGPHGGWLNKGTKLETDEKGNYVVNSRAFNMLRTAQGFERNEELSDYLKLNMVYSLLFSSSKYNPMKASRILAECTLTVLGFEDEIGKTDSDTAIKIFNGLKQ